MALTHLLDTSVYSQPLRKVWLTSAIRRWRETGDDAVCISAICEAELLQGLEFRQSRPLWDFYEQHLKGRLAVLPVDQRVAEVYARLHAIHRRSGKTRPPLDLLIASTARAHNLVLATLDIHHFQGIEGLAVEDWSK